MIANSPAETIEWLDRAFKEGDLEAVLSFYEDAAVVMTGGPQGLLNGRAALRQFFADVIRAGLVAKQIKTRVIEADGIALFLSRWHLGPKNGDILAPERTFVATSVLRKRPDGGWGILIDNPFGPTILDSD